VAVLGLLRGSPSGVAPTPLSLRSGYAARNWKDGDSLAWEQSRVCYVEVTREVPMELKMRNTLSKTMVAGVTALSLTVSLFATTEPASAAFRYGGGGFHGGGYGWHGGGWRGGWGGGWWGPAVVGGLAAGALLAAPYYGYGYGSYCGYGYGPYCGYGYPSDPAYPGYAYSGYRAYPGYAYPGYPAYYRAHGRAYTGYPAYTGYAYPGYAYTAAPYRYGYGY
jgi:hypothetical protein